MLRSRRIRHTTADPARRAVLCGPARWTVPRVTAHVQVHVQVSCACHGRTQAADPNTAKQPTVPGVQAGLENHEYQIRCADKTFRTKRCTCDSNRSPGETRSIRVRQSTRGARTRAEPKKGGSDPRETIPTRHGSLHDTARRPHPTLRPPATHLAEPLTPNTLEEASRGSPALTAPSWPQWHVCAGHPPYDPPVKTPRNPRVQL